MNTFVKRMISFVLTLVMVLGMLPMNMVHVHATETASVENEDTNLEIDYERPPYKVDEDGNPVYDSDGNLIYLSPELALSEEAESKRVVTEGADIDYDYYWSDENPNQWRQIFKGDAKATGGKLRQYLESEDPDDERIVLMEDMKITVGDSTDWEPFMISSDKVLDLNGHVLEVYDKRNGTKDQSNDKVDHMAHLFEITNDAQLTILDSCKSNVVTTGPDGEIVAEGMGEQGRIFANGYMINHQKWDFWYYTHRDIFWVVAGDLVIYGGEFQAGRQKDQLKSNFSWDNLKSVIGDAVALGTSIFEYATGIEAATAARGDLLNKDMYENLREDEDSSDEDESTSGATGNNGETAKKDGTGGTEEKKNETPASAGNSAKKDEQKDQTVAQKQNDKNAKGDDEAKKGGDSKENKADDKETAKKDPKNSEIADANKKIGEAALNKDAISSMVDTAIAFGEGLYDLFGSDEATRATACIQGTVARVGNGSTLVVYDGNFIGHGSTPNVRNAVIEVSYSPVLNGVSTECNSLYGKTNGGLVYIYDGTFTANAGANVFNMYQVNNKMTTIQYEVVTTETINENGQLVYTSAKTPKAVQLAESESYKVEEVRYENLNAWAEEYGNIPQEVRDSYDTATSNAAREAVIAEYVAGLDADEREAAAKLFDGPTPVKTANIQVRGGTFRNYYEPSMMAIMDVSTKGTDESDGQYCPEHDVYDDDCDDVDHNKFSGTPGCVNLGVESFGEDMIKDGRIQLVDVYGQGKLVLLDGGDPIYEDPAEDSYEGKTEEEILEEEQAARDEEMAEAGEDYVAPATPVNTYQTEGGFRHYRLYISDLELRAMQYLSVYPNTAVTNTTQSFALKTYWGTGTSMVSTDGWASDDDNIRAPYSSNEKYFEYQFDAPEEQQGVYIMPDLGQMDAMAAGLDLAQSSVWYYNIPVNAKGEMLGISYTDTYMESTFSNGCTTKVSFNRTKEEPLGIWDDWYESLELYKTDDSKYYVVEDESYLTNIKYFTYKVYRVDPLSRENINENEDQWDADEPLLEIRYGASNDSLKCKITLKELEKAIANKKNDPTWTFRSGELYRVEFSVEEHIGYGYMGTQDDGEVMFLNTLNEATSESSILFRCVGIDENKEGTHGSYGAGLVPDWTPLQFVGKDEDGDYYKNEAACAGEYATVELINGQTGIVDYEGARIFDIYYQWYILDDPDDETPTLIAGTDNVWVAQNPYNNKQFHKPGMWMLAEDGSGRGYYDEQYANTVDPTSEAATQFEYNQYGLPVDQSDWTYEMLHMYTYETCNNHEGMKKDAADNLYMANNNTFWGNTDSIYIPAEYAGKYLQCKVVAVNVRYPYLYDNLQTIESHAVQIVDASVLIPEAQEPEMTVSYQANDGAYVSETVNGVLGQDLFFGFTGQALSDELIDKGFEIRRSQRVYDAQTGEDIYLAENGDVINLKNIIQDVGRYYVEQIHELYYNRVCWSLDENQVSESTIKQTLVTSRVYRYPVTMDLALPTDVDIVAPEYFDVGQEITLTATAVPTGDYWYRWMLDDADTLDEMTVLQDSQSAELKYTFTDETPITFWVAVYAKDSDGNASVNTKYANIADLRPGSAMVPTLTVDGQAVSNGDTVYVEQGSSGTIKLEVSGGMGDIRYTAYKGWTILSQNNTISYDTSELGYTTYKFSYADDEVSEEISVRISVRPSMVVTDHSDTSVSFGYSAKMGIYANYTGFGVTGKIYDSNSTLLATITDDSDKSFNEGTIGYSVTPTVGQSSTYRMVLTDYFGNTQTLTFTFTYDSSVITEVEAVFSEEPTVVVYAYDDSTKTDDRVYTIDDDDLVIEITAQFVQDPSSDLYADERETYGNIKPVIGDLTGQITIRYYESYEAYIANYSDYTTLYESQACLTGATVDDNGTATWKYDGDLADNGGGSPGFYVCVIYLYNNNEYAGTYTWYNVNAEYLIMDSGEEHVCNFTYKIAPNEDGQTHTWHCVCGATNTVEHAWSAWNAYYKYGIGYTNLERRYCAEASSNQSVGGWCNTYVYRLAYVDTLTLDQTVLSDAQINGSVQLNASLTFKAVDEGLDTTGMTMVDPDTSLTWTSSDESVATVDANGNVNFVGSGTATITVTSTAKTERNGASATATCEITVACDHSNAIPEAEVASTCCVQGTVAHYVCPECGKISLTGDFTDTVTVEDITLELVAHAASNVYGYNEEGHFRTCKYGCGYQFGTATAHTYNVEAADCTTSKYCTICKYEAEAKHSHDMLYVDKIPATCTDAGIAACYYCNTCGKYFYDEAGTLETTEAKLTTKALGHTWNEATCESPKTCSVCGATEGSALGHNWLEATCAHAKLCLNCGATEGEALEHTWVDATCSEPKTCSVCYATEGEALGHTYSIAATCEHGEMCEVCGWIGTAALDHTLTHYPAADPTCTAEGNLEYWSCSVCGNYYSVADCTTKVDLEEMLIAATGHTEVIDAAVEATCTETGLTEGSHCSVCSEVIVAQEVVPALGHDYVDGVCTRCGAEEPAAGPIVITTQPVDYVGLVGDTATFTVVAEGDSLTYQWYYYDTAASEWKKSSGNTSATMSVEFKAYRNNQEYRCEITDADGNTVTTNVVKIVAQVVDLVIVTQPVDHVGSVNDNVSFTVEATGNGLTYQWYYSDNGGTTWVKSGTPGFATNNLLPILRTYRDGYVYYCQITDIFGNTVNSDVVSMTVKASEVVITKTPVDVVGAKLSSLYYFEAEATGDNLEFRWEFSKDGGETWELSWNQGYNTPTLGVRMNANRDGYLYRCKIVSGLKTVVYTEPVSLNLQAPSVNVVSQSGNVAVIANMTATFTVEVEGTDLSYVWYRSNDKGVTWIQTYLSGYNTDTLSFVANTARAALYKCKITDGSGKAVWTDNVKLQILSAELKILTQPVSMTCASGETATFTVEAQGDTLTYQWYASADGGATWTKSYLGGYNTETFSFAVNAARASKLYKCVITDAGGNTVETDAVSVTIG